MVTTTTVVRNTPIPSLPIPPAKAILDFAVAEATEGEDRIMVLWAITSALAEACNAVHRNSGNGAQARAREKADTAVREVMKNLAGRSSAQKIFTLASLAKEFALIASGEEFHRS